MTLVRLVQGMDLPAGVSILSWVGIYFQSWLDRHERRLELLEAENRKWAEIMVGTVF